MGNSAALSIREAMLKTAFGSELLGAYVTATPDCPAIEAQWTAVSADIFRRTNTNIVMQLEMDQAAWIWLTAPPLEGELAKLYGKDLLTGDDRVGTVELMQKRTTIIMGPYKCTEGFDCMFTVTPIFLPVPDKEYNWGCAYRPTNCTNLCWDPVTKLKYWGQVSTMINMDPLVNEDEFQLQSIARRGYRFRLSQEETSFYNPSFDVAKSSKLPVDPTVNTIKVFNLLWHLELAPTAGWVPSWRNPCIAAVVVGSLLVSLLVMWLLVSKEQHNRLLKAMLPAKVIRQLQDGESTVAQEFDAVTILFSDIVGYTTVASQLSAWQVVTLLNELFTLFDELVQRNGVYKVETIGDALMCAAGCPTPDEPVRNAVRMAHMALDMVRAVEQFRPSLEHVKVQIRVGMHSGPVVAGVVGKKMPRYCLFGDTVNTSSRMESTSQPMRIQVSEATARLLAASGCGFELEQRGAVQVKGKGHMETYWLVAGPNVDGEPSSQQLAAPATARTSPAGSGKLPSLDVCEPRGGGGGGSSSTRGAGSRVRRLRTVLRLGRSLSPLTRESAASLQGFDRDTLVTHTQSSLVSQQFAALEGLAQAAAAVAGAAAAEGPCSRGDRNEFAEAALSGAALVPPALEQPPPAALPPRRALLAPSPVRSSPELERSAVAKAEVYGTACTPLVMSFTSSQLKPVAPRLLIGMDVERPPSPLGPRLDSFPSVGTVGCKTRASSSAAQPAWPAGISASGGGGGSGGANPGCGHTPGSPHAASSGRSPTPLLLQQPESLPVTAPAAGAATFLELQSREACQDPVSAAAVELGTGSAAPASKGSSVAGAPPPPGPHGSICPGLPLAALVGSGCGQAPRRHGGEWPSGGTEPPAAGSPTEEPAAGTESKASTGPSLVQVAPAWPLVQAASPEVRLALADEKEVGHAAVGV